LCRHIFHFKQKSRATCCVKKLFSDAGGRSGIDRDAAQEKTEIAAADSAPHDFHRLQVAEDF
jgi:hypothetical protein